MIEPQELMLLKVVLDRVTIPPQSLISMMALNSCRKFLNSQFYKLKLITYYD